VDPVVVTAGAMANIMDAEAYGEYLTSFHTFPMGTTNQAVYFRLVHP
jgi:hypothetical protein